MVVVAYYSTVGVRGSYFSSSTSSTVVRRVTTHSCSPCLGVRPAAGRPAGRGARRRWLPVVGSCARWRGCLRRPLSLLVVYACSMAAALQPYCSYHHGCSHHGCWIIVLLYTIPRPGGHAHQAARGKRLLAG